MSLQELQELLLETERRSDLQPANPTKSTAVQHTDGGLLIAWEEAPSKVLAQELDQLLSAWEEGHSVAAQPKPLSQEDWTSAWEEGLSAQASKVQVAQPVGFVMLVLLFTCCVVCLGAGSRCDSPSRFRLWCLVSLTQPVAAPAEPLCLGIARPPNHQTTQ
jgi:hypothetical protein